MPLSLNNFLIGITLDWIFSLISESELISKRTEQWIIESPEQWLWAHRRWGK